MMLAEQYFSADNSTARFTWAFQVITANDKMQMNLAEHRRNIIDALGGQFATAVGHILTRLRENMHHIKGRTPPDTQQQRLHGAWATILATMIWRAVHQYLMAAFGLTFVAGLALPLDHCFHGVLLVHFAFG